MGLANPLASGAPTEEPGLPLLPSEAECAEFRRRTEVPSHIGRYVFAGLGAILIGAAWGIRLVDRTLLADGLFAFGLVLVVLAYVQHRLLLRAREYWPTQVYLWHEGLELVLTNGEIRALPWSDGKFALDFYARPVKNSSADEMLLDWTMDPKVPMCPITKEGFEKVQSTAMEHGLELVEYRADNRRRTLRGIEIRARPEARTGPPPTADSNQPTW